MNVQIQFPRTGFSDDEVRETIDYALQQELEQARLRRDHFASACRRFELMYGMDSDAFLEKFEAGELGDDADFFDWFAAKRGYDLWEKRYQILRELVGESA